MPKPVLGDVNRALVERLARRRVGILAIELAEYLDISDDAARKFLMRLVAEGTLSRPGERRRRPEVFGNAARGAGGYVFRAPRRGGSYYARSRALAPCLWGDEEWDRWLRERQRRR